MGLWAHLPHVIWHGLIISQFWIFSAGFLLIFWKIFKPKLINQSFDQGQRKSFFTTRETPGFGSISDRKMIDNEVAKNFGTLFLVDRFICLHSMYKIYTLIFSANLVNERQQDWNNKRTVNCVWRGLFRHIKSQRNVSKTKMFDSFKSEVYPMSTVLYE